MTPFEHFFEGNLFVINLARRPDRMKHFQQEMRGIGVTRCARFEAIDAGPTLGNHGCTASHRALLSLIIERRLPRACIFEDDATVRDQFRDNFQAEVVAPLHEIPDDWEMFYLGGHYAEIPRQRISQHVILTGQMKTTSSYGVTLKSAKILRDLIPEGSGDSIDNLYAAFNASGRCYISDPRFFVQYNNYSDLQRCQMNNTGCMEDNNHVMWLDAGLKTVPAGVGGSAHPAPPAQRPRFKPQVRSGPHP